MSSVLYDVPGPRAKARNTVLTIISLIGLAAGLWYVYDALDQKNEWAGEKWKPFTTSDVWENFLIPGIEAQLKAFAFSSVLAIAFGLVFGVLRMSTNRWVRTAAGAVIEFFRAVPLLILMFFVYFGAQPLLGTTFDPLVAVVVGLTLYNGSVLAEVVRAGVNALPKGQSEAGLSIGMRPQQVMNFILLPQGLRAMLPAVIAQLVVVMKDSSLGYIIGYTELVRQVSYLSQYLLQASIVVALIFLVINLSLSGLAVWVEKRLRTKGHTSAVVTVAPNIGEQGGGGA
ncbi:MAG TPA: amino acid ABC transporter permease [Nocardioidaceae bacterium]|nr:amino acid ABC transporter permease [Nocardioidaceae bacterium]